jgi:hypothetical protein
LNVNYFTKKKEVKHSISIFASWQGHSDSLYDGPKLDALYIYINYGCDNNNVMMVITEKRSPSKKLKRYLCRPMFQNKKCASGK